MTDQVTPEEARRRSGELEEQGDAVTAEFVALIDSLAAQVETITKQLQTEFGLARDNLEQAVAAEAQAEQMRAVVEAARDLDDNWTKRYPSLPTSPDSYHANLQKALAALEEKPPT